MSDFNALTNIVREAMPLVQAGISALAGGFITAMFLRGNTSKTEFEKIKAGKINEVLVNLVDKHELTFTEMMKCRNMLEIAKKADTIYTEKKKYIKQMSDYSEFDFDWLLRYFESVGNVSDNDMQMLWAKILANGLLSKGNVYPAFIELMKNIDRNDAVALNYFFCEAGDLEVYAKYMFFDVYIGHLKPSVTSICMSNYLPLPLRPCSLSKKELSIAISNLHRLNIIDYIECRNDKEMHIIILDDMNLIGLDTRHEFAKRHIVNMNNEEYGFDCKKAFITEHEYKVDDENVFHFIQKGIHLSDFGARFVELIR